MHGANKSFLYPFLILAMSDDEYLVSIKKFDLESYKQGEKSLSLVFRETKVPDIRRKMTGLQTQVEIAKARSHVRYWHVSSG